MLNFTLKQLRYVEAADRLGSITGAANELNISQSSITAAITGLESRLGFNVFIRTPAKGICATASGRDTLALVQRFIHQARQFDEELGSMGSKARGTVRIACYATAAPSFLPPVLRAITRDYPDVSIQLLEGDMERVTEFLNTGDADLAFTYRDSAEANHNFEPLFTAPPYAMLPVGDPLARQDSVSLDDLTNRPMVLLDLPRTRDYFISMFEALELTPNVVHTSRSSEIVRALVAGGFGFSFLNIRPVDYRENESGYRILPIRNPPRRPVFGIATMAGMKQPRMVRSFIRSCIAMKEHGEFSELSVQAPETETTKK